MRLFSASGEPAVVGVGIAPIGIFAIGQFARGIVAVGQVAIGVVVLGQGAISIVGIGQVGIGITWFVGMVGLGGRGFCLRLIPGLDPPRASMPTVPVEYLLSAPQGGAQGFVSADIGALQTPTGAPRAHLFVGGQPLPIKPTPATRWALENALRTTKVRKVFAHLKNVSGVLVCDRLVEVPGLRPTFGLGFQIFRIVLLCAAATLWWSLFVWTPLVP